MILRLPKPRNHHSQGRRSAYTLLEMVLSLSIGLVILAALYLSLERQFSLTQAGRDVVQRGTLARAVLTRIGNDVQGHLGPVDPRGLPDPVVDSMEEEPMESTEKTESTEDPAAQDATANNSSSSTTNSSSSTNKSSTTKSTGMGSSSGSNQRKFNLGVRGEPDYLTLSVSRMSRDVPRGAPGGDLRRVNYWIVPGKGLARHEVRVSTSDDAALAPQSVPDPEKYIIAPEVQSISFQYFDGTSWSSTWDGNQEGNILSADINQNTIPSIGPPAAIAIVIEVPRSRPASGGEPNPPTEKYRFVITLPAGNNFPSGGM